MRHACGLDLRRPLLVTRRGQPTRSGASDKREVIGSTPLRPRHLQLFFRRKRAISTECAKPFR